MRFEPLKYDDGEVLQIEELEEKETLNIPSTPFVNKNQDGSRMVNNFMGDQNSSVAKS